MENLWVRMGTAEVCQEVGGGRNPSVPLALDYFPVVNCPAKS